MTKKPIRARALSFAAHKHTGHKRKYTFEPYTNHLVNVAELVASVVDDPEMVVAALLHDTIEDTATTADEIRAAFGDRVAGLVVALTDTTHAGMVGPDGKLLNRAARKVIDRDRLANVCTDAKTIKLADLIDNTKDITRHDPKFAKVYLKEKAALLEVLGDGHPDLLARAKELAA